MADQGFWQTITRDAVALFDRGGPVLYVLAILSIAALAILIAKVWQFADRKVGRRRFIGPALVLWRAGERANVINQLAANTGPVARVMLAAARGLTAKSLDDALLREEVARIAQLELGALRSGLRGLEIISQIAPLLGLLGTVLGMIDAFKALQEAGPNVDAAILAGGIWTALLTTAAGLIVAIPAAAAHYYLDGRLEREREAMETATTALFTAFGRKPAKAAAPARRIKRVS